jgi:hypothetical protein
LPSSSILDLKLACKTKRHLPQGRVSTAMIEFASWYHRAAVYPHRHFIAAGGMSKGIEPTDLYRRTADYIDIDSILKGERPGDLPVQNPTKFETDINVRTAMARATVPQSLLQRPNEVIGMTGFDMGSGAMPNDRLGAIPLNKSVLNDRVSEGWWSGRAIARLLPQPAGIGIGISLASFRRFWAVAARWNSSRAPFDPRNRSRSSFRMRLRCANSISTFLRWQRKAGRLRFWQFRGPGHAPLLLRLDKRGAGRELK